MSRSDERVPEDGRSSGARMPLLGDAPRLAAIVAPVVGAAVVLTVVWPERFTFLGKFWGVGVAAGIVLAAVGVVFWVSAAVGLIRAYGRDRPATRGAFGLARHPIFAWWVFFILPPAALITNSWLFLIAAVFAGVATVPSMRREDIALAARYGEAYEAYRGRVRALVPIPRLLPITVERVSRGIGILALTGAMSLLAFYAVVRPVMLGLGVTAEEHRAPMAGDDLIRDVRSGYTQAVTIGAPPAEVWKWLIQIGYGRGGWYNVDAINRLADRDYFYEGTTSAGRIIPELQTLRVGDSIAIVPQLAMTVAELIPERRLLLVGNPDDPAAEMNAVWLFELRPVPDRDNATRLVVRFSSTFPGGLGARLANGFVNEIGGAIIQQPAMLHGLKIRAEGRTADMEV
ncbi:MAG: methyltransferase family protein [bacterium]